MAKRTRRKWRAQTPAPSGAPPSLGWNDDPSHTDAPWTLEELERYERIPLIDAKHPMFKLCTAKELKAEGLLTASEYKAMTPGLQHTYATMTRAERKLFVHKLWRDHPPSGWGEIVELFQQELRARGVSSSKRTAQRFLSPHVTRLQKAEEAQATRKWMFLEPSPLEELIGSIAEDVAQMGRRSATTDAETNKRYSAIAAVIKEELAKLGMHHTKQLGWSRRKPFYRRVAQAYTAACIKVDSAAKGTSARTVERVCEGRSL